MSIKKLFGILKAKNPRTTNFHNNDDDLDRDTFSEEIFTDYESDIHDSYRNLQEENVKLENELDTARKAMTKLNAKAREDAEIADKRIKELEQQLMVLNIVRIDNSDDGDMKGFKL